MRFDRPCIPRAGYLHLGEVCSLTSGILYIAFETVTQCSPKYSSRCDIAEISRRYLLASSLLLGNDGQWSLMQKLAVMKNEKLKSTTVRFTDSDLRLIESLREKLGLGMIHIIRLAIRRLAESENLLPSKPALSKR